MRDLDVDVVVVGYGAAGASAAIAAADAGASVVLLEKSPHLGGLSLLSSGYLRAAADRDGARAYLDRLDGGRVPGDVLDAMAGYLVDAPRVLAELAGVVGARAFARFGDDQGPHETSDLYDWPGRDAIGWTGIEEVAGFGGYPWASPARGHLLMAVLERHVEARPIEVRTATAATGLVLTGGRVAGVEAHDERDALSVRARRGVVLASGGFEFDDAARAAHLPTPHVEPIGHRANTGDGVRLAAAAGAAMWHLWHVHGSYGFRIPGRRPLARNHLGGARRTERPVAWIVVDRDGHRFMNEVPPAPQDTPWRELGHFDTERGEHLRVPCWTIFDEVTRQLGPIGHAVWSDPADAYEWSADNRAEIDAGIIVAGDDLPTLAARIGAPGLVAGVQAWNDAVDRGRDPFGRPPGTMRPLRHGPFYAIETWPIVSNTQGGPRHDGAQRVLDAHGLPIPGLYAAGELGSSFGQTYLLGGNLTEAVMGGRAAGRHAAAAGELVRGAA